MLSAPWVWQGEVVQHGRADFGHVLTSGPVTVARGCEAPIALGLCAPWRGEKRVEVPRAGAWRAHRERCFARTIVCDSPSLCLFCFCLLFLSLSGFFIYCHPW